MASTTVIFQITCLTNMHAGSGGAAYGIIDNLVQRDHTTNYPILHATSLKGALREFCTEYAFVEQSEKQKELMIEHIFGSSVKEGGENSKAGRYKFFSAHLLSLPVRSNKRPYYNGTAPQLLRDFINFCDRTNPHFLNGSRSVLDSFIRLANGPLIFSNEAPAMLEGKQGSYSTFDEGKLAIVSKLIGESPALFHDRDFGELVAALPVVARNQLENGISQNLWYEEVVPRQSRFFFAVMHDGKYFDAFVKALEERPVQIGANATVGYGFCSINKMYLS